MGLPLCIFCNPNHATSLLHFVVFLSFRYCLSTFEFTVVP
ncbi:hypothetical protein MUK42_36083 [Musa troglodytarum]|uniref:Uncharacterized protein n=1 Tax=Musa troglodytarum TaxID=320322 RepID=A0A9E7EAG1_9LILI|nr:hypothetical protein MUK42_36083 [Musa troglodytarum]